MRSPFIAVGLVVVVAAAPGSAQVAALISRNSAQEPADSHSYRPALSSDGRWVAFEKTRH